MKKNRGLALLPFAVFIVLFAGVGIISGDFYGMPALLAFLTALFVGMLQNRELSFNDKMAVISKGAGDINIITMVLIFLLAGAFSGVVSAAGGVTSAVNFGLSIVPSQFLVVGLFVIGCFISLSMGTSMGTIAALAPIALGIAEKTGFSAAACAGAVVCGAMFGDNLSMISDTTIAAVRTQGCEMKDKFKQNFFIVLPAAILTVFLFYANSKGHTTQLTGEYTYDVIQIIPYFVVLIGALIGFNVFSVLIVGIVLSSAVGVAQGTFTLIESFKAIGTGMTGLFEISIISIIVACIVALVKENGGIDLIIESIKKNLKGKRGAEFGIALLIFLVDLCTANNTIAIVMAGPIAKEIGDEFGVEPKRVASILDIFASVGQGLIPYGAQLLTAAALLSISPIEIMPYLYYQPLMAVSVILFILFRPQKVRR
ncbi:Na+/H+ antiporter NhaC family protein [Clostridium aminobutyricum]|uniref:Na+/H+ antiporter NhaC family protein n=1 Tax=Clostridium aminobutyricum TaxID=33953 RepID=A0A939D813_CLOAM|nr:Na+/H+ antiporter NhaC family protein [Clostridium aminobutyricum]MBN7772922.1 Na+/H+ antiporter NhaC family protein [Clostridium aminobutyricum]